ncbi:MAG: hypothetical protein VKP72_13325 [bacterium]|nr:hypothetical protein [bacterium]
MSASEQVLEVTIPTAELEATRRALLERFPNILIGTAPLDGGETFLWLSLWSDRPQALEQALADLRRDRPDFQTPLPTGDSLSDLVARAKRAQAEQASGPG